MKLLSVPDFHFDRQSLDVCKRNAEAVRQAAIDHRVDFIAIPGDLYHRPLYATDAGGINDLIRIVESWLDVCPVYAVEGTPGHDAPGSYGPLEKVGLVLLRPGLHRILRGRDGSDCSMLFGIPELRKDNIQASLRLPAERANAEAVRLVREYIAQYIAPIRSSMPDIPAIGLLHGVVTDSRREDDPNVVVRASDIVIPAEYLAESGVDYWCLGHWHQPRASRVVSGGYAGSWGRDWNETGYVPAFDLVVLDGDDVDVTRIPYGTPRRETITDVVQAVDADVAYRLKTADPEATLPDHVHPWSEIQYIPERKTSQRAESIGESASLWDLFKLIDPEVPEQYREKIEQTEQRKPCSLRRASEVRLKSVEVRGCDFFGGRTVRLDVESLPDGLTAIIDDNGAGKSSLLAFMPPYPVIVGKIPRSGRLSAIKEFFYGQDSRIINVFDVNGQEHVHLVTIKGAHTKSAKTECYLTIDGIPQLEQATFDTMMEKCEELYGPYHDYLLTTFYVQPLQGDTQSGLMCANMTDIRDLVLNIAGINREAEKRHALDRVAERDGEARRLESRADTLEEQITDDDGLEEIRKIEFQLKTERGALAQVKLDGTAAREKVNSMREAEKESLAKASRLETLEQARKDAAEKLKTMKRSRDNAKQRVEAISADSAKVRQFDSLATKISFLREDRRVVSERNANKLQVYQPLRKRYDDRERAIAKAEAERSGIEAQIKYHAKRCSACGFIEPGAAETVRRLTEKMESIDIPDRIPEPAAPVLEEFDDSELVKLSADLEKIASPDEIESMRKNMEAKSHAEGELCRLSEEVDTAATDADRLLLECEQLSTEISRAVSDELVVAECKLQSLQTQYATLNTEIARKDERLKALLKDRERNEQRKSDLVETCEALATATADVEAWRYISRMLNADKIPALELSMVLDAIDADATRNIAPYHDGRYTFRTVTQSMGKAGVVDRFDIMIHDAETGIERSYLGHSPGERAFFNDAYVKALVRQRNAKGNRFYSPIISDEADGPVHPPLVPAFYDMQERYYADQDVKVLVVSHATGAHQRISSRITMEDVYV